MHRAFIMTMLVMLTIFLSGCQYPYHPDSIHVTYVNNTNYVLHLRANEQPFRRDKPLDPGTSIRVGDRLRYWGDATRIQAVDEDGVVRFDKTITKEELQEMDFRIIIE